VGVGKEIPLFDTLQARGPAASGRLDKRIFNVLIKEILTLTGSHLYYAKMRSSGEATYSERGPVLLLCSQAFEYYHGLGLQIFSYATPEYACISGPN
jgi:hypothetical protein